MATITSLPATGSIAGTDELVVNQGGADRRVLASKLAIPALSNVFAGDQTFTGNLRVRQHTGDSWSIDGAGTGQVVANNASIQIAPSGAFSGRLMIINSEDGQGAEFFCCGGNVKLIVASADVYAVGADIAGKTCVFFFNGQYFIQNKTGSSRTYHITSMRGRAAT